MVVNKGDVLYLDSENGMKYTIEVVNVNDYREPSMKYAIDMIDGNGVRYTDACGIMLL
jgi:hypothetical protein